MGYKYIIEIPEDKVSDFLVENNTHLFIPYSIVGYKRKCDTGMSITPYTEPDIKQVKDEAYNEGYKAGRKDVEGHYDDGYSDGYDAGLDDAWKAARKIVLGDISIIASVFDTASRSTVIRDLTAAEAIEKLKAYEQEQNEKRKLTIISI